MLPTIKFGGHKITRLITGGNPFSGNSHMTKEKSEEMADYYTVENIKKALFRCEDCGINTMQTRADRHIMRINREYRNEGGKLKWIAQTASEMKDYEGHIKKISKNDAIAVYHHGSLTDNLFKAGKYDELKKRIEIIKKNGLFTGLGTHMPEVIEYSEEQGWNVDFYMACVFNLSKVERESSLVSGKEQKESFDMEDIPLMYKTIRATQKPCLAFKILGAGRRCNTREKVKHAFKEAFENIKPVDAVVVGMFQKEKDQVFENSEIVKEIFADSSI